jgi:lambda repressor-like predicted transcriptional regulator
LRDDPQELYRQTSDPVRRQLNDVFFDRLYLDTDVVVDDRLAEPFNDFLHPRIHSRRRVVHTRVHKPGTKNGAQWDAAGGISTGASLLDRIAYGEGLNKDLLVELVHLYSNPKVRLETLQRLIVATPSARRTYGLPIRRQRQIRLDAHQAHALAVAYRDGQTIKELALRYGVHRATVSALLRRCGVELRLPGLAVSDAATAARLYEQGWSLARLGQRFGVDDMTVRRALLAAGVIMRSPHDRRNQAPGAN